VHDPGPVANHPAGVDPLTPASGEPPQASPAPPEPSRTQEPARLHDGPRPPNPAGAVETPPAVEVARDARPVNGNLPAAAAGCTAPQLRRFIKSRPYVPMHELRRRFGINGVEDDVTPVDLADGRVFVGLPPREGGLLGELLRGGEIGYELSLDPCSPVVVGLYPMRPVPRV
jgi:hypothetical protein